MEFEFDPQKSESNKTKHRIDFDEAQELWKDVRSKESLLDSDSETRYMLVGRIGNKHWSAIYTYRNDKVRLISVRRSRRGEINDYEKDIS
jgi:uncharacterized DUF497 family protein